MVAKITEPASFRKAIYYNEHKVAEGVAELIGAGNFLKEPEHLSMAEKIQRFDKLVELHKSVHYNTLHISLNFDPSEKLSKEKLLEIAQAYMEKIGFGDQPWLVYQHNDTHHPHIHIVTTTIRADGEAIYIHNIARNQSQEARRAIEIDFDLVKAESKSKGVKPEPKGLDAQRLQYGKSETKRGITNVLDTVLKSYTFSSLSELNAILSIYNVRAERGEPGSRLYKNGGLLYQLLDENGKPIGIPIKASSIYSRPTLAKLEKEYMQQGKKEAAHVLRVKQSIDQTLRSKPKNLDEFIRRLRKEQIYVIAHINKDGFLYGLTFVDTHNKSVINGSDITKEYGAKKILEKLGLDELLRPLPIAQEKSPSMPNTVIVTDRQTTLPFPDQPVPAPLSSTMGITANEDLIEILLKPEQEYEQTPDALRRDKKRKWNQTPKNK
jgi:hypothetical protein